MSRTKKPAKRFVLRLTPLTLLHFMSHSMTVSSLRNPSTMRLATHSADSMDSAFPPLFVSKMAVSVGPTPHILRDKPPGHTMFTNTPEDSNRMRKAMMESDTITYTRRRRRSPSSWRCRSDSRSSSRVPPRRTRCRSVPSSARACGPRGATPSSGKCPHSPCRWFR